MRQLSYCICRDTRHLLILCRLISLLLIVRYITQHILGLYFVFHIFSWRKDAKWCECLLYTNVWKHFRLIYVAYFKKVVILDAVQFSAGKASGNCICAHSLIKIESTRIFTINNVRKLAKNTKLFKPNRKMFY